jgi:NDP-hexose-3-ketoreductase
VSDRRGQLRVGVLGAGRIALDRMVPALLRTPTVKVVAIASRDAARAARAATRFGVEAVHGYPELLKRDDVDAVYVPLPPALHAPWTRAALEAGKHVLVEKPLATCARDAREVADLAESLGLVLMESFMFLHHSQHATVRRLLDENRIGELRAMTADFGFPPLPATDIRYRPELGGGALLDAGVYPLRAAQLFLGSDLTVLGATLHTDAATQVDVAGAALLRAPGGVSVTATFGFTHAYRCAYELWGSQGRIVLNRAFTPPPTYQPVLRIERQNRIEELTLPPDDQFANIANRFAIAILNGEDSAPFREAAVRQAILVDAVRRVAADGAGG